jgi:hypothetical protein
VAGVGPGRTIGDEPEGEPLGGSTDNPGPLGALRVPLPPRIDCGFGKVQSMLISGRLRVS